MPQPYLVNALRDGGKEEKMNRQELQADCSGLGVMNNDQYKYAR